MAKTIWTVAARAVASLVTLVAGIIMVTNYEKIDVIDHVVTVKYCYWNSFKFFMYINIIGGGIYNFLVLFLPSGSMQWRLIVFLDMVNNIVLIASLAAAQESYNYIKYGNFHVGWSPICSFVPNFCSKILGALITGLIGFVINICIFGYSLHVILNPFLVDIQA